MMSLTTSKTATGVVQMLQKQIRFAAVRAVNVVAKEVVAAHRQQLSTVFDRPRPVTVRASRVLRYARSADPVVEAVVAIDDGSTAKSAAEAAFDANVNAQGKSAVPPAKYLAAEITGGVRVAKRFELSLQRAGVMPAGMYAVFAKRSQALDQYGNLSGAKIVQILSWFQAFPETGYRANMTQRSKEAMAKGKRLRKGQKWGMAYFRGGRNTGLPDGVWERHYPNGMAGKSFVRPVLIFVRTASYRIRFDFHGIAERVISERWDAELSAQIKAAIASARL